MCGIAGIFSKHSVPASAVHDMTTIIRHRGPDDEGFTLFSKIGSTPLCLGGQDTSRESFQAKLPYSPTEIIGNCSLTPTNIALGHRRLSILDLSPKGHQPQCDSTGKIWLSYNGEIYNYIELRNELLKKGYIFITDSDTEVIVNAYKEWGAGCQEKFKGMWAILIYDNRTGSIFLSRDRYGIKPLYYWNAPDGSLLIGSEIKQFTQYPLWKPTLNSQRAYDYLFYGYTDHTDECLFKDVYQIPAGHYSLIEFNQIGVRVGGRVPSTKWYHPKWGNVQEIGVNEAAEQFRKHFTETIKLYLRSDVPVGTALSGGLDSSAIVCVVNEILRQSGIDGLQKSFSSCNHDVQYSEFEWMQHVINHTTVDPHFVYPTPDNLFQKTKTILWYMDEPYQSQSAFLGFHVFELAAKNGVKVLLNGQGADEYLGGYGQLTRINNKLLLKNFRISRLLNEVFRQHNGSWSRGAKELLATIASSVPAYSRNAALSIRNPQTQKMRGMIDLHRLQAKDNHPDGFILNGQESKEDMSHYMLHINPLPKYLRWEDRNSMAHSVEARVPFLDHELVEYTDSLPIDHIQRDGWTKWIMREALRDVLPTKIVNRKDKKGFITPEERWVRFDQPTLFLEKTDQAITCLDGIINQRAKQNLEDMISGKTAFNYSYWRIILFSEWVNLHGISI